MLEKCRKIVEITKKKVYDVVYMNIMRIVYLKSDKSGFIGLKEGAMKLVEGFCVRKILDETIIIPTGKAAHCLSGLIAVNETGEFLFQLLQTEQTKGSLVAELLHEFEVEKEIAEADVEAFVNVLIENEMLETE